jgi:hypothetical protein
MEERAECPEVWEKRERKTIRLRRVCRGGASEAANASRPVSRSQRNVKKRFDATPFFFILSGTGQMTTTSPLSRRFYWHFSSDEDLEKLEP